jgi:hypothetical protein
MDRVCDFLLSVITAAINAFQAVALGSIYGGCIDLYTLAIIYSARRWCFNSCAHDLFSHQKKERRWVCRSDVHQDVAAESKHDAFVLRYQGKQWGN